MTMQVDGFTNFVSNLGRANGKTGADGYVTGHYGRYELEAAYRSSTWLAKVIDIPADDATREWRSWQADKDQIELLEAVEARLQVRQRVNQALKWADLYGGAVIVPDLPGNPATPFAADRVRDMRFLHVLHRYQINAHGLRCNPLDPDFGKPEYYSVTGGDGRQINLHPSRVILINGHNGGMGQDVWGDPLWLRMADSILASDGAAATIRALMQEAKVDVVRIDRFMDGLAGEDSYENTLQRRFNLVAVLKSVANVVMLDKEDEWEQKTVNWSGLPDVTQTLLTIMAGAADVPVTRLIGTSAQGLNATGEGDLRNYYDSVRARQDLRIGPMLTDLDELIIRVALGGRPPEVWYDWKPLWQPSEKERAETQKLRAETFAIELQTAAIDETALTKSYINGAIESGLYPGLEAAIAESGSDGLATAGLDVTDAAPRTLYVHRKLLNTREFLAWARGQGFEEPLAADDLHVTVTYSRAPVDWMVMGNSWDKELIVPAGGPRLMERFGDAIVLLFSSTDLQWRHEDMVRKGASFDYDQYQPHVTITYKGSDLDLSTLEPYQGELRFGPEVFEEVNDDWSADKN